jgi:hypothetical protein
MKSSPLAYKLGFQRRTPQKNNLVASQKEQTPANKSNHTIPDAEEMRHYGSLPGLENHF